MHMSMRSDRALPEAAGLAGATDGAPTKSAISWGADAPLRYPLLALLAAGLGEMLLLRLFSRVGFHIPKGPEAALAFQGVADVGSFAFNLATVLAPLARERGLSVTHTEEAVSFEMPLPADFEDYLNGLDKKQRHEVRRKMRRIGGAGIRRRCRKHRANDPGQ